jgi:hypothetical protein
MRIVFVLIGLVVGILDFFIRSRDFSESVFKAFVVAGLLFIGELVLEIRDAQKLEKETFNEFVNRNRNLTGTLLAQLNAELERSIKIQDKQFVVDHETLAILSYDTFWKLLVEQIEMRRHLTVHTIHSCAIDVWVDHPLTTSLLNRQREFCEKGRQDHSRVMRPQPHSTGGGVRGCAKNVGGWN